MLSFKNIMELIKFNITILVLVTCYIGYYLGLRHVNLKMVEFESWITFIFLILGTFLSSSGASMLNQYIERKFDSKMERTKNRPIPSKLVKPNTVLFFGLI